jgi:hypothetical protein
VVPDGGGFCGAAGLLVSTAAAKRGAPTATLRTMAASKGILRMNSSRLGYRDKNTAIIAIHPDGGTNEKGLV